MTFPFQSPGHKNTVYAPLKCPQDRRMVNLAAARQPDDSHIRRVRQPHHPSQICRTKGAVVTGKCDNSGFPIRRHIMGRFLPGRIRAVGRLDLLHIYSFFEEQIETARTAGIHSKKIVIDPGIGFGKTVKDNFEIIQKLDRFKKLNCPLLIGVSRKSFIGKVIDADEMDRQMGTASAVAVAILNGAHIVRVHDVAQMVQVSRIADGIVKPERYN